MEHGEAEVAAYIRGVRHGWNFALMLLDISQTMPPEAALAFVREHLQELADATEARLGPLDEEPDDA